MAKFSKFNRTDLTPTQIQERKRRRMMRDRMMFGMPTPKGTPNIVYTVPREPVVKASFFTRLKDIFNWLSRLRSE